MRLQKQRGNSKHGDPESSTCGISGRGVCFRGCSGISNSNASDVVMVRLAVISAESDNNNDNPAANRSYAMYYLHADTLVHPQHTANAWPCRGGDTYKCTYLNLPESACTPANTRGYRHPEDIRSMAHANTRGHRDPESPCRGGGQWVTATRN